MFQDEAGFGRIDDPSSCWCYPGHRPIAYSHQVREYQYAFGAVSPSNGESFFLILPKCNTTAMNLFLTELSKAFPNDYIIMPTDNAGWHKSGSLIIPDNIELFYLPAYTPEMNVIEQIWREIRKRGFKNKIFKTLKDVVDKLCEVIVSLEKETVMSITGRDWILSMF